MTELRNRTNTHKHHESHREGERHSSIRFYRRSSHQKNGPLIQAWIRTRDGLPFRSIRLFV